MVLYKQFFATTPQWGRAFSTTRFLDHTPQSVRLLWKRDQLVAETSTWQHTTLTTDNHPCSPAGFQPTVSADERLQTYALHQCFSIAGPRPGTGPWNQLYRAARGSPGICHFSFLRILHESMFCSGNILRRKIFVKMSKNPDPDVGLRKLQYATRFH